MNLFAKEKDGIFPFLCLDQILGIKFRQQKGKLEVITSFVVYVRTLCILGRRCILLQIRYAVNFAWFFSMFSRMILANPN